jgi:hypothetical protein
MTLKKIIPGVLLALVSTVSTAEVGGLLNGRAADLNRLPDTSVELGINLGDYYDVDYQYLGVRYNYRVNPNLMAYGDVGSAEFGRLDEIGFGIGGFYMLHDLIETADTAVKFSFHNIGGDIDVNVIALEGLISGRNGLGSNPDLTWYANVGFNRISGDGNSETDLLFGAGVIMPTQSGEIFGGLDMVDDIQFGIGYRHFL